jgi:NADH-quinone oxidoreductase subunit G
MAANPKDDLVNVEVDGVPVKGRKGAMIIQVTDANNAYVPRFCYHDRLPIAANCRMCLVEVEKAPKPLPACATPIAEGMKIFTRSRNAIAAQKATMEFLLINHPLDCPICDQGGECELQDLAMGFGRDISRFVERKRVVKDKNLGPLVSTDMTRCIHCTRCVRFGQDIAGIQELGTTGRGEHMEIGTFIEHSVDHELSGNIIDLCPVGALNSKPFRYHARSWEMTQHELVSPHDGVGSNLFGHVLRGRLMRVVPRTNDSINETWIADRDRFSYEGIYSADRLQTPMLRENGRWVAVSWERALEVAVAGLRARAPSLGTLVSPGCTLEEQFLAARLTRGLGSGDVDHRLRMRSFAPTPAPALGVSIEGVESLSALLVVGSNLRSEVPLLAHRVRKAARRGTNVAFLNPVHYDVLFPVAAELVATDVVADQSADLLGNLLAVLKVVDGTVIPAALVARAAGIVPQAGHRSMAAALQQGAQRAIWLGAIAQRQRAWADLHAAAGALAAATGARLGVLAEGANAAGACIAGCVPHLGAAGAAAAPAGKDLGAMLGEGRRAFLLFGSIEPAHDIGLSDAAQALRRAEFVVAVTPWATDELRDVAHLLLPMGTFAETSGTFVNLEGRWQSFAGAARPVGEARPGWKVARVLGTLLGLDGFGYQTSEEVRDELRALVDAAAALPASATSPQAATPADSIAPRASAGEAPGAPGPATPASPGRTLDVPMYQVDALVRRSSPLQATRLALQAARGAFAAPAGER